MNDYNIEWLFEKMFNQLTNNFSDFYNDTIENIYNRTFNCIKLQKILSETTKIPIKTIEIDLNCKLFKKKILYTSRLNKLHLAVILNDLEEFKQLSLYGYEKDYNLYKLICINKVIIFDKYLDFSIYKNDLSLTNVCAEYKNYHHYSIFKKSGIVPSSNLYEKAAIGGCIDIIQDIAQYVALSDKVVEAIFKSNKNDTIKFVISEINSTKYKVNSKVLVYPIINCNYEILDYCRNFTFFNFDSMLFYSAILSKSITMIKYINNLIKVPDDKIVYFSNKAPLINEICYTKNGIDYYSHAMNYGAQSDSVEIIEYLYKKDFRVTVSNIITAITQSSIKTLQILCKYYLGDKLPKHILLYFSNTSFVKHKYQKLDLLIKYNLIDLDSTKKKKLNDYQIETIHKNLINECTTKYIFDEDYLYQNYIFCNGVIDQYFFVKLRYFIYKNDSESISALFYDKKKIPRESNYLQTIIDMVFLYGNIQCIKQFVVSNYLPSTKTISEIMCRNQLQKLCLIIKHDLVNTDDYLLKICYLLSSKYLHNIFTKKYKNITLKDCILSNNIYLIKKWIDINTNNICTTSDAYIVLECNNIEILKLFNFKCDIKNFSNNKNIKICAESMFFIRTIKA